MHLCICIHTRPTETRREEKEKTYSNRKAVIETTS